MLKLSMAMAYLWGFRAVYAIATYVALALSSAVAWAQARMRCRGDSLQAAIESAASPDAIDFAMGYAGITALVLLIIVYYFVLKFDRKRSAYWIVATTLIVVIDFYLQWLGFYVQVLCSPGRPSSTAGVATIIFAPRAWLLAGALLSLAMLIEYAIKRWSKSRTAAGGTDSCH